MNRKNFWSLVKGVLYTQLFIATIVAGITFDLKGNLSDFSRRDITIFKVVRPFSHLTIGPTQAETMLYQSYTGFIPYRQKGILLHEVLSSTGIPLGRPQDMLTTHIQAMAWTDEAGREAAPASSDEPKPEPGVDPERAPDAQQLKNVALFFYCTHNGESYRPDCGKSRLEGERGLINQVAAELQKEAANKGFNARYINTVHDYPDFAKSYANSRVTVQEILNSNRDVDAIFDIHRDAYPQPKPAVVEIDGKKAARILIVVGTDERKPHPHWEENAAFAKKIHQTGEKLYPGLIKGVRTKAGTYNQEFHEHALLLEFGNDYNRLEEALYSARLFTDVLCEVFKEMKG